MTTYTVSTLVRLSITVTDPNNVPIDPTTMTLKVQTPDGAVTDMSGSIVHEGVGAYHADYLPVVAGLHQYEWVGTGAAQVSSVNSFLVNQSLF